MNITDFLPVVSTGSVAVALLILARLSRRLGLVTRTPRYYRLFYLAAALLIISAVARFINEIQQVSITINDPIWVTIYLGFPAIGLTLGVIIAWRYWSWLLAERG